MDKIKDMFKDKENGVCPFCKNKINQKEFIDDLSKKEFKISGLCMSCQIKTFER